MTFKLIMNSQNIFEGELRVKFLWHAKMIFIQLSKYHATFKILFNFVKYIMQLSKYGATSRNISYSSGRMYIFWEHVK